MNKLPSKKELFTMCQLLDMSIGNSIKSYLSIIAPKWPESRQILMDLFTYNDLWMDTIISYVPLYYEKDKEIHEFLLKVYLVPSKAHEFVEMASKWEHQKPPTSLHESRLFNRHSALTYKKFKKKTTHKESFENIHGTMVYSRYFYTNKIIKEKNYGK